MLLPRTKSMSLSVPFCDSHRIWTWLSHLAQFESILADAVNWPARPHPVGLMRAAGSGSVRARGVISSALPV